MALPASSDSREPASSSVTSNRFMQKRVSRCRRFSGKNGLGYFTPGISFTLPHSGLLNIGYSFGNDSFGDSNATKNRYLFIYYWRDVSSPFWMQSRAKPPTASPLRTNRRTLHSVLK